MALVHKKKGVVPHNEAKGSDIIGIGEYTYIIRSDLGYYLRVKDLESGKDGEKNATLVRMTQPHCMNGDHYFATKIHTEPTPEEKKKSTEAPQLGWGLGLFQVQPMPHAGLGAKAYANIGASDRISPRVVNQPEKKLKPPDQTVFYILKGEQYQIVQDLVSGKRKSVGEIAKSVRGADFYMATWKHVILIGNDHFVEIDIETWSTYPRQSRSGYLHHECKGGLYYWTTETNDNEPKVTYHILKGFDTFGANVVHCTNDLKTDEGGRNIVLHSSVSNFIPGGVSFDTIGKWNNIFSQENRDDEKSVDWKFTKSIRVGYNKEVVNTVQSNWHVEGEASFGYEGGAGLIGETLFRHTIKAQFTVRGGGGGYSEDTTRTSDSSETSKSHETSGKLGPKQQVNIWQYEIRKVTDQDEKTVLYTPHVVVYHSDKTPTHVPFMDDESVLQAPIK